MIWLLLLLLNAARGVRFLRLHTPLVWARLLL
jgi:hypothetical protein